MITVSAPLLALAGGILIGVGALMVLLVEGRICGISGITRVVFTSKGYQLLWRLLFIGGLLCAPLLTSMLGLPLPSGPHTSTLLTIIAGLLVGVGTTLGNGCTSGHGVCGLSRLSPRSWVAVCVFIVLGMATVTVLRHSLG